MNGESEWLETFRARLERHVQQSRIAEGIRESVAVALPDQLAEVVRGFDPPELFKRTEIDYVDSDGAGRIEMAWPAKCVGIRLTSWPRIGDATAVPDFFHTDAALREREWLILPVDPESPACGKQMLRALQVVKRMGAYRR